MHVEAHVHVCIYMRVHVYMRACVCACACELIGVLKETTKHPLVGGEGGSVWVSAGQTVRTS